MSKELAILDALCRQKLDAYANHMFDVIEPATPYLWNWHIGCICEHLEASYRGEIKRLIINIPPRTLKTVLVSVMFPSWVLGHDPSQRFITTSFKFELAQDMSYKCRDILQDDKYKRLFPNTRIDPTQSQKHNFQTTDKGQYYSSSMSSVTGKGGSFIICDDPLNPDEAASEAMRKNVNNTIRGTLFSRFNDPKTGRFILVMQRLHEDDPTGNLLQDEGYTVLKLPAEAPQHTKIILNDKTWEMEKGELLFSERLDRKTLDTKRIELGEYHYTGQYLQDPVPIGGGEFKDEWIQYYQAGGVRPKIMNIYILVDPAGGEEFNKKKKKTSDYSAFMVVGTAPDNNYYLLDVVRDRLNPTERVHKLFELHKKWNALAGKPPKVGYEKYGMMTDTHYIKNYQEEIGYRFAMVELGGRMMKEERIRRLIPDLQTGRWWLPANLMYTNCDGVTIDLIRELVYSEMASFPRARFDDMLDALSRIYEDELRVIFPAQKTTHAQEIVSMGDEETETWMDF